MPRRPMSRDVPTTILNVRTHDGRTLRFSHHFHVGRSAECEVQVDDHHVSRKHVLVSCSNGQWYFTDLQSRNGVFVNGVRSGGGPVSGQLTVRLGGDDGPELVMRVEAAPAPAADVRHYDPAGASVGPDSELMAEEAEKYFRAGSPDEPVGPRTMYIRKTFQEIQKKQRRRYYWVLGALVVALVLAGGKAWHASYVNNQNIQQAARIFYLIRDIDLRIARAEQTVATSGSESARQQILAYRAQRREAEASYDRFLAGLNAYGRELTEQEKMILRVTRMFGECDLIAPANYLSEVNAYIQKWKSTRRFETAVRLAQERGYIRRIVEEFEAQGLPPQFFYLAMQESSFNPMAVGTPTNYGFAKGMWQFIPATGQEYGLKLGPLSKTSQPDPMDERSHWEKATRAAAKYIKTIYRTDAQASGLLVMASYNWGERRVVGLMRQMPENPQDRNFWKLLAQYRNRVPGQTYDYVFYIVSAAVIGENPRLFGFSFDNPLKEALGEPTRVATASPPRDARPITASP